MTGKRYYSVIMGCATFLLFHGTTIAQPYELIVSAHLGAGFFCEFLKVINNILYFEDKDFVRVRPDWTYEFFPYKEKPDENGWDLYFEPINVIPHTSDQQLEKKYGDTSHHELHDHLCRDVWTRYAAYLPYRVSVRKTIKKYIKIKKHIRQKAYQFYLKHMKDFICIGIHVRYASAHSSEIGGHPDLEQYIAEANALIKRQTKPVKIFLATDSNAVISYFKRRYPESMLVFIDAFRAQGSEDPHLIYENADYWLAHPQEFHQKKPGYFGGETALIDGLLLAKCRYFIHTSSNVATFVACMNPYGKSIYLPKNIPAAPCRFKHPDKSPLVKNQMHLFLS